MKRFHDSGYGPTRRTLGGSEESAAKRARNRERIAAGKRKRKGKSNKARGVVSTYGMTWQPPRKESR